MKKPRKHVIRFVRICVRAGIVVMGLACGVSRAPAADLRDGLGFGGGLVTGLGFTYIHHSPSGWATQGTGILLRRNERAWYSLGGTAQRTLAGGASTRVYVGAGGALFHVTHDERPSETKWNFGVGVGLEALWHQYVGIAVELNEAWLTRTGDVVVAPAAAVRYYF
jgi:hypothetical protein